ncbi:PaaI family thioesterase [Mesoterricola silvestris]|uniref:Phenylacetic acid degradation protein n=1 Tax=Mesoterricola silvestris TaxID=2927979 RepID=A0AA48KAC1_9BACT|nr:PaaI family thioesterase [Mesoterricola silvestris]BDU73955.1 phenylacetic acid degradation protein [Mesoterricola silvestris]
MTPAEIPIPDLLRRFDERMAIIPYSRMAGMSVVGLDEGGVTLHQPARPEWSGDVSRGRIHTGCICALADTACGFAVGASLGEAGNFATLDLRMDYLRSAEVAGDLTARARCHRVSRSVAFVTGEVRQPGSDEAVALVNATFMRTAGTAGGGPRRALIPAAPLNPVSPEAQEAASQATHPAIPEGRSPYVDLLGVVLHPQVEAGPILRMPFRDELIGNPRLPAIHGGVLAGFAETVMFMHLVATSAPMLPAIPKAVDFSIDYLRPARPVDTFGQGITIRLGNRVSLVQASLWQEDPQRPVAATRGHWLMPGA